jgi:hypothetical protein
MSPGLMAMRRANGSPTAAVFSRVNRPFASWLPSETVFDGSVCFPVPLCSPAFSAVQVSRTWPRILGKVA